MLRLARVALLTLALAALAAGCGGGEDETASKTFNDPAFGITFDYPATLKVRDDIRFNQSAGVQGGKAKGLALDKENLLAIQRFDLNLAVTQQNLPRLKPALDQVFSQAAGSRVKGKPVTVGGLPGLEYQISLKQPASGQTRATALFDGKVEYLLNCQSTPEKRTEIGEACDTALKSLKKK